MPYFPETWEQWLPSDPAASFQPGCPQSGDFAAQASPELDANSDGAADEETKIFGGETLEQVPNEKQHKLFLKLFTVCQAS